MDEYEYTCRVFFMGNLASLPFMYQPMTTDAVKTVTVGWSIKFNYIDNEFSFSTSWYQRWVLSSESRLFLPLSDYQMCRFRWFSSCRDLQWNPYEWRWHDCKYFSKLFSCIINFSYPTFNYFRFTAKWTARGTDTITDTSKLIGSRRSKKINCHSTWVP